MAITTLSNKVDTIMDNRTHDKRIIDILNNHILTHHNNKLHRQHPIPTFLSIWMITTILLTLIEFTKPKNNDIALKISPSRASGNNIQFLYTPISSTHQLKYISISTFLHFWRDFTKLQRHLKQILRLENFLSPHVISELIADQNGFDSNDKKKNVECNSERID